MLYAGDLKDRVKMFRQIRFPNESGGGSFNEENYLNTFAKVEEVSSNPELLGSQEVVQNMLKVTIRFRPQLTLTNGDKMTWRGFTLILNNFKVDPFRTRIEMYLAFDSGTTKRTSEEAPTAPGTFDNTFDNTFN